MIGVGPHSTVRRFTQDGRGSSAVEFALVSMPFIMAVLMVLQMGVYYMAKSSLDSGVIHAADTLVNNFNASTAPPTGTTLKTWVVANSGGMIHNNTSLAVDLRLLSTLSAAVTPITDGQVDTSTTNIAGTTTSILVLRAQSSVPVFLPKSWMGSLANVYSSAIVRRQS